VCKMHGRFLQVLPSHLGVALGTYHCVEPKARRGTQLRGADAGSEARWAKAAERAEGVRDAGIGIAVRYYFRVHFPVTVLLALGAGFGLAAVWPELRGDFFSSGLYLGLILAALGIGVGGLIYANKTVEPLVKSPWMGVTAGLTADEVKHVRRQILAKEPVAVDRIPVLRGAAVQMRGSLAKQLLTMPGLVLVLFGLTASRDRISAIDVVMIALLLVVVVFYGMVVRWFRQSGAFLRSTRS
jgi:hypothetical protein